MVRPNFTHARRTSAGQRYAYKTRREERGENIRRSVHCLFGRSVGCCKTYCFSTDQVIGKNTPGSGNKISGGTARRRLWVDGEREVFEYPHHLTSVDKFLIQRRLCLIRVLFAERALEIGELDHGNLGVGVAAIFVPGHVKARAFRIRDPALSRSPEGDLLLALSLLLSRYMVRGLSLGVVKG